MQPYNPLDKLNLGKSVADALLKGDLKALPAPGSRNVFVGAGVYAIYYFGTSRLYPAYEQLAQWNQANSDLVPIYVGKAIPAGGRTGAIDSSAQVGPVLFRRLQEHAESIQDAENLELDDFKCRYLLVDDIWIPLGESLLIQAYRPIWNVLVGGFGNHDPGGGRLNQMRSHWDTVHPGRAWARRLLRDNAQTPSEIDDRVRQALANSLPLISQDD